MTTTTPGTYVNIIPPGSLTSSGGGTSISNTSEARATLIVAPLQAPTVSKSFNPGTIWVGGTSQLSIVIRNNHPSTTLTQASLRDDLPVNVFLANPVSPTLTGCGGAATLTAVSGTNTVTLNNGTIAPNSTCTITVTVTSNVQGAYTNTIPQNRLGNSQNLTNASPATARLNVDAIGLTKRFLPSTFPVGGTSTLIITLQNPTGSPYTGAAVTDNLPAPLIVNGAASSTCGVPPGTVSTTSTSVSLAGGTIPAGSITTPGTCTISVQVTVPAGTPSGPLVNSIPPGGLRTDQVVSGNPRRANATVTIAGTEVSGAKSFSPATIPAGGNSRLRIDIFAPSDTNLTNFSITDNLPTGVTVSNSTAPTITGCGAAPPRVFNAATGAISISLTNGLILAGQRCRIDVFVTSSTPAVYTNTIPPANITNTENRAPAGSLSANLTVTGSGTLSIAVSKGFDPLIVTGGAASTMSIELVNPGNVTLTGIAFTDDMPVDTIPGTGMILANPLNFNVGTCGGTLSGVPGANSFSYSGGSLPPFGQCTLTLSVTMTVNGNLTNTIPAGRVTTANGLSNVDPVEASLTNLPGASVSKSFSPNPIPLNSYSLLTITVLNTGNIELIGMGLSDSLPAGLVIAGGTTPAPVNNCGGILTAVSGTQLIQLQNGTLAGNSSCTIVVSITGSNPGDYQNTIPAGALVTDPSVGATNNTPATDRLVITGNPVTGGGGGGGDGGDSLRQNSSTTASSFLIPVTGFQQGVVTDLSRTPYVSYRSTSVILEIPSLSVNIPIVGVPLKNGEWNVTWLGNQAGWLEGSAFPSWNGNSVLTSHVYLSNGKPGPFAKLHELKFGDQIIVHAYGQEYIFEVRTNAIVAPNDKSVMKHEERPWLTLVTCTDYDEKTGTYKNRFIVRAILMKVSEDR
ncbi:MAG TPA: sortase [Anaerolineales bacterium]|nr:sortase [Anaerolineales bacterium]